MSNHLTSRQMLAYIDGELSRAETRRVDKHLHSCWTCLAEMERLKSDIATILDAKNEAFVPALPPPPRPWPGFDTLLARKKSIHPASRWERFSGFFHKSLSPVRMGFAAGIFAVLLVGAYSIFHTGTVSAKEVLQHVENMDRQRSTITKNQVIRERVHIRKVYRGQRQPKLTRVETWKSTTAAYWNVASDDDVATDLKAKYKTHEIPLGLPLSAASVDSWGKVAGGNPTVSRQGADVDLSFHAANNGSVDTVKQVSFIVQPETWKIKQLTLDFSDASFEVTEDDYSVVSTSEIPGVLLAYLEPEALPAIPAQPDIHPVSDVTTDVIHLPAVNLDQAELDVLATLHRLNADLGEPVTLARSRRSIDVGLWALPPNRQEELRTALSSKAGVRVEITVPHVPPKKESPAGGVASPGMESPLEVQTDSESDDQRLLKYFGNPQREQDFTNEALGTSTAILSHLYALRNLQTEFSAKRTQLLAPDQQVQLSALVQDHATAISASLEALSRQLSPLNTYFDVPSCAPSKAHVTTTWQDRSLEALENARNADHLLRALLTTSQTPAVPDSALPEIWQKLCLLRTEMATLGTQDIH